MDPRSWGWPRLPQNSISLCETLLIERRVMAVANYEKLGIFYLGRLYDLAVQEAAG